MNNSSLPKRPRGRPSKHGDNFADTKNILIRRGIEVLTERGVNAMSLDDLMKSVQIPKGSFYHYFPSKNDFVLEVLDAYEHYFVKRLNTFLTQTDISFIDRLQNFVNDAGEKMQYYDFKRGCILGNLGQEVSYLDPKILSRIETIFKVWEKLVSHCLYESNDHKYKDLDCDKAAYQFWIGWEGAVLRARLVQSQAPLHAFFSLFIAGISCPNSDEE